MNTEIIITAYQGSVLTCLYEDDKLCEIWPEPEESRICTGDIYVGKVKNIVRNINAAFVEIQPGVMGYYSLSENRTHYFVNVKKTGSLSAEDEILVQVSGENLKSKEWPLTDKICLQGSSAVYFPWKNENRISRKIKDAEKIAWLNEIIGNYPGRKNGWTFRTAASKTDAESIMEEMHELEVDGNNIMSTYASRTCFSKLHSGDSVYINTVKRYRRSAQCRITTDIPEIYDEISSAIKPGETDREVQCPDLRLYSDTAYSLISLKGIKSQLEKALGKRAWLPSGGYLIIETTEALSVIDVNTGKNIRRGDPEQLFFNTNMEAAAEALRQIRLRNLSGIIVIDFVNMKEQDHISQLIQQARESACRDPIQTTVIDMTALQLLEITRKKSRRPLADHIHKL